MKQTSRKSFYFLNFEEIQLDLMTVKKQKFNDKMFEHIFCSVPYIFDIFEAFVYGVIFLLKLSIFDQQIGKMQQNGRVRGTSEGLLQILQSIELLCLSWDTLQGSESQQEDPLIALGCLRVSRMLNK